MNKLRLKLARVIGTPNKPIPTWRNKKGKLSAGKNSTGQMIRTDS